MGRANNTFRDAIRITWRLRLRYLWIDSLCIIQNDSLDIGKECAVIWFISHHTVPLPPPMRDGRDGFYPPQPERYSKLYLAVRWTTGASFFCPAQVRRLASLCKWSFAAKGVDSAGTVPLAASASLYPSSSALGMPDMLCCGGWAGNGGQIWGWC